MPLKRGTGATIYAGKDDAQVLRDGGPPEAIFSTFDMPDCEIHPTDVDVEFRTVAMPFPNGRALLDDPATRIVLMPEWRFHLGLDEAAARSAMLYVREAIDRYWAEGGFELTVHVGAARGRKA